MRKKAHIIHYFVLVLMLVIGVGAFFAVWGNKAAQLAIGIATAIGYLFWGIIHHAISGDLHPRIVIEYILIVVMAVVLLVTAVI